MATDVQNVVVEQSASSQNQTQLKSSPEDEESRPVFRYVMIGVITIALVLLVYYAYSRFVENSVNDGTSKNAEQERDDPVTDFNLREAIKNLQNIQNNVLKTLSEVSDM